MTVSIKSRVFVAAAIAFLTAGVDRAFAQDGTVPPPPAVSPPPVGGSLGFFGERGQIVLSGDLQLNIIRQSQSMGGGSSTAFLIQPALDYFVSPNFSVGGFLGYGSASSGSGATASDDSAFIIGARAGYNVVLTNAVSLWVRGGFEYLHASTEFGGMSFSGYRIPFFIFAPVLWHPTSHFFIGAGPAFQTDLVASTEGMDAPKTTEVGIASTVGGYFGGL